VRSTVCARRRVIFLAGAAAAALTAAHYAGAALPQNNAADVYSWQFKFTKNDILRYRVKTEYTGSAPASVSPVPADPSSSNFHIVVRSVARQEVHRVDDDDGTANLLIVTENPTFENNGKPIPGNSQSKPVTTRRVTAAGIVTSQDTATAAEGTNSLDKWALVIYSTPAPAKPVKIGDSWKTELPNPFVPGAKIALNSTLVGKKTIGDTQTLEVKIEASISTSPTAGPNDVVHETATYNVDPAAGRLIRMDAHMDRMELSTPTGLVIVKFDHRVSVYVAGDKDAD